MDRVAAGEEVSRATANPASGSAPRQRGVRTSRSC
jgi:hypothetical protein